MSTDTADRMKIVIGYAVWASLCAVVAGVGISLIHTWFFAHEPGRVGFWRTLFEDGVRTVAIAAGQGAVALVTGSLLAHLGRALHVTQRLGATGRSPRPRAVVRPAGPADRRGARAAHGGGILPQVRDRSRLDRSAGPLPVGNRSRRRGGSVGGSAHPRWLTPVRRGDDRHGRRTRLPRPVGRRRTVRVARAPHRRAPPRRMHGRRDSARLATRDRGTRDLGAGWRVHGPDPALAARAQPRSLPRLSRSDRPRHRPARVYDDLAAHFQPGARGVFPAGCGRRGDGAVQRARLLVPRGGRAAHAARHEAARLA